MCEKFMLNTLCKLKGCIKQQTNSIKDDKEIQKNDRGDFLVILVWNEVPLSLSLEQQVFSKTCNTKLI